MEDVRAGVLWSGDGWLLFTTRAFGDLLTLGHSPLLTDVSLRTLRGAAQRGLSAFTAAIGDDDALRLWFTGLSAEQQERLCFALARAPI